MNQQHTQRHTNSKSRRFYIIFTSSNIFIIYLHHCQHRSHNSRWVTLYLFLLLQIAFLSIHLLFLTLLGHLQHLGMCYGPCSSFRKLFNMSFFDLWNSSPPNKPTAHIAFLLNLGLFTWSLIDPIQIVSSSFTSWSTFSTLENFTNLYL